MYIKNHVLLREVISHANLLIMPRGRPKGEVCMKYIRMVLKELTHGRWEQAKKRLHTKTDDGLANYLLDLYFNRDSSSPLDYPLCAPSSDRQCSGNFNKYTGWF